MSLVYDYPYIGSKYSVQLYPGRYKFKCWGSQGGGKNKYPTSTAGIGGQGGYSVGFLRLENPTEVFIYVGGMGTWANSSVKCNEGGFNGGGNSCYGNDPSMGGGGATDIRIGHDSLYARVIVAGGGGAGGEGSSELGGFGGGLAGGAYGDAAGGTQTGPGRGSDFGIGASHGCDGGGAGSGWYGGGISTDCTYISTTPFTASKSTSPNAHASGGGSGYVYTSSTYSSYPSGCLLNSSFYLEDAQTIGGDQKITELNGTESTGHSGDGHVRITLFGIIQDGILYMNTDSENVTVYSKSGNCNPTIQILSKVNNFNVVSIRDRAFYCDNCIVSVQLPSSLVSIGTSAFENAAKLESIIFDDNCQLTTVGDSCFARTNIKKIDIPGNLIGFSNKMFADSKLETIKFGDKIESIGSMSFYNTLLKSISIPKSVKSLGIQAFAFSKLEEIKIHENSTFVEIPEGCFTNTSFESIYLPQSVRAINTSAFENSSVSFVSFSKKARVDVILERSFFNCNLSSISLPGSVISIGRHAFANCKKLVDFHYCSSVYQGDSSVFDGSLSLNTVIVSQYYVYDLFCGIHITNVNACFGPVIRDCTGADSSGHGPPKYYLLVYIILD